MLLRQTYELTQEERQQLLKLRGPGLNGSWVWTFWKQVAYSRGLDHHTIMMTRPYAFSALPLRHDKHWCYPSPLQCKRHRMESDEDASDR